MKIFLVLALLFSLTACELLPTRTSGKAPYVTLNDSYLCQSSETLARFQEFCELSTWNEFMITANESTWLERNNKIKALSNEPKQRLQQILLSQGLDTPYINRLRAQNWLKELKPQLDDKMKQTLELWIEKPSQQMLELESAISILSKVNSRQERSLTELQETLNVRTEEIEKQREQVQQLLQIEANMSDQKRSN